MAANPIPSTPSEKERKKQQKLQLKNKIIQCLSRFKLPDLTCETILNLIELEPSEIHDKVNELKFPFNKKSVIQLLSYRVKAFKYGELENISILLQVYCSAFYSNRKIWTALNLLEPEDNFNIETDLQIVRRNILQAFRIKGLNAVVEAIVHEDLVWLIIIEKKLFRKKGIKLQTPVIVCYETGTPYLFVASSVPDKIMQCILRAMLYKKFKTIQLTGKNIKSLLSMLKNKVANVNNALVEYKPDSYKIGFRSVDVTKMKARETYANEMFKTKDPVLLETFTVSAESMWKDNNLPEMKGQKVHSRMHLSSRNLIDMVKYMIVNEMVPNPLPEYIKTILRGRNKVALRDSQIQPTAN